MWIGQGPLPDGPGHVCRLGLLFTSLANSVGQAAVAVPDQLGDQFVPAGEVPVKGGAAHPHLLGDRLERQGRHPGPGDLLPGPFLHLGLHLSPVPLPWAGNPHGSRLSSSPLQLQAITVAIARNDR